MTIRDDIKKKLENYGVKIKSTPTRVTKKSKELTAFKNERIFAIINTLVTSNIDRSIENTFDRYSEEIKQIYTDESTIDNIKRMKKELLMDVSEQILNKTLKHNMDLINHLNEDENTQIQPDLLDIDYLCARKQFFTNKINQLNEAEQQIDLNNTELGTDFGGDNTELEAEQLDHNKSENKDTSSTTSPIEQNNHYVQYKKDLNKFNLNIPLI